MRMMAKLVGVVVLMALVVWGGRAWRRQMHPARIAPMTVAAATHPALSGEKSETESTGVHMVMSKLRPEVPADAARTEHIAEVARKVAAEYADYRTAEAAGYHVYMPEVQQTVYHFVNKDLGPKTLKQFDLEQPPSLLYVKTPTRPGQAQGYKMVGVMYIAPYNATEDEIDARAPLSVARWHLHTDVCVAPQGNPVTATKADGTHFVGTDDGIRTEAQCKAAGGKVKPHSVWMVHLYPNETTADKIWAHDMDDVHDEPDTMAMPAGMKM